jgi:hypothetical protein
MGSGGDPRAAFQTLALTAVGVLVTLSGSARAQDSARASAAEQLFHDGRALIVHHRFKDACEKFASSQKLDPSVGTLLSLGDCNMGQGKTASAWLSYRRALALANERKDPRNVTADERANAVEPQLSRLVVRFGGDARGADVQISVNGERLERDVLLEPMPIDPGPANIQVSAPGYRGFSTRVQVGLIADTVTVVIPALERLPDPEVLVREHARATATRTLGLAMGGVGLVAVAVGSILGMQAIVKVRDANEACPSGPACSNESAVRENTTGTAFADASSVVLPIGAALLGIGSYLYLTTRHPRGPEIGANVTSDSARVRVVWSW